MKNFLKLQDKNLGVAGYLAARPMKSTKGAGMLTRSRAKMTPLADETLELLPVLRRRKGRPKKKKVGGEIEDGNKDTMDVDAADLKFIEDERSKQKKNEDEQNHVVKIHVGALLILDDCLLHHSDLTTNRVKENRAQYLETLTFLKQLATVDSHHLGCHYLICSQNVLSSTGNSFVSECIRTLRQNLDNYIVFGLQTSELRTLLTSISSGGQYQKIKEIFLRATARGSEDSPSDVRRRHSYLCFSLQPAYCDKSLAFR